MTKLELPPFLRIQATVVKRHAERLALIAKTLTEWDTSVLSLRDNDGDALRAAIVFALAVLMETES